MRIVPKTVSENRTHSMYAFLLRYVFYLHETYSTNSLVPTTATDFHGKPYIWCVMYLLLKSFAIQLDCLFRRTTHVIKIHSNATICTHFQSSSCQTTSRLLSVRLTVTHLYRACNLYTIYMMCSCKTPLVGESINLTPCLLLR